MGASLVTLDQKDIEACHDMFINFMPMYYASFDNLRHLIGHFYADTATLSWNGNSQEGCKAIEKYLMKLPSTHHVILSLDSPILDPDYQSTYVIMVSGTVQYTTEPLRNFQQTVSVTLENNTWKIISDCYRLLESLNKS